MATSHTHPRAVVSLIPVASKQRKANHLTFQKK